MVSGRQRGVRIVATLGVIALLVACSTYGEDTPSEPVDGAVTPAGDGGGAETGADGPIGVDAPSGAKDGPSGIACPTCPDNMVCFASGCDGATKASTCEAPIDITGEMTFLAFVCPGVTANLPAQCLPDGGPGARPVLVLRLGATSNRWKVSVSAPASNAFLSGGSCQAINSCVAGTNGRDQNFDALAVVMIGTTNVITSCIPLSVTIAKT